MQRLRFRLEPAANAPGWVFCSSPDPLQPQKKGDLQPLYQLEFLRNGKWESPSQGWCATGAINVRVEAGSPATFDLAEPGGEWEALRVGVDWTAADATATRGRSVVWSAPVRRNKPKQ